MDKNFIQISGKVIAGPSFISLQDGRAGSQVIIRQGSHRFLIAFFNDSFVKDKYEGKRLIVKGIQTGDRITINGTIEELSAYDKKVQHSFSNIIITEGWDYLPVVSID
jgi:hypothetical protein